MSQHSIAQKLDRTRRILDAALAGGELQVRLAQVGYDEAAMATGRALYAAYVETRRHAQGARSMQLGNTTSVTSLRNQVRLQHSKLSATVRTVFADDAPTLARLGLRVKRRATQVAQGEPERVRTTHTRQAQHVLLDHARQLYDGVLHDLFLQSALVQVGYSLDRLQRERNDVAALERADVAQQSSKASAKAHTVAQREALAAMNAWTTRFIGIVVPAFADRPDLLQSLGLKARWRVAA